MIPTPWEPDKSYFNKKIIQFDSSIEEICIKEKVPYIKMYNKLSLEDLFDGLHPNEDGHQIICNLVLAKIKDIIKTM